MLVKRYLNFINKSKTPYHLYFTIIDDTKVRTVSNLCDLRPSDDLYVYRPNSSLIFLLHIPQKPKCKRMVATHSDSPCLKLKGNGFKVLKEYYDKMESDKSTSEKYDSKKQQKNETLNKRESCMPNELSVPIRTYGGGLFHTFFDRLLSLSGLVVIKKNDSLIELLVDDLIVAILPSLPPHLNSNQVYERGKVKFETDKALVLKFDGRSIKGKTIQSHGDLKSEKSSEYQEKKNEIIEFNADQILSHDLSFIDQQLAMEINGYIHSGRQDNLLSTFSGLEAIKSSKDDDTTIKVFMATDFEEVGSKKLEGAYSNLIRDLWLHLDQFIHKSGSNTDLILSADVSHAYNPNFTAHFDPCHKILFGESITLKRSNTYATDPMGEAIVKKICDEMEIKYSDYENKSGIGGGATIGTILSFLLGTRTVDIGTPTMAMHSARELSCWNDIKALIKLFRRFYNSSSSE